jgi:hypothetical protein
MPRQNEYDVRREMLRLLLGKVADDPYPSATMLDLVEALLEPDEVSAYAELLMQRIRRDNYPSIPLMQRVLALS